MVETARGKQVAILVADGFEQSEMADPRKELEKHGIKTKIISPENKKVKGWKNANWADEFPVDVPLDEAKPEDYSALLLPGGVLNPDKLRMNPQAIHFIKHFVKTLKPIAAICHGPSILISAGSVEGFHLTSWPSIRVDLVNAGAKWVDEPVVTDRNLVTSRKPGDIPAFSEAFIKMLSSKS